VHRNPLLALLNRTGKSHSKECGRVDEIRESVRNHPKCFERDGLPGHITGSAWIVSPDRRRFPLTHPRKLDRWLRLGDPADGGCYRCASFRRASNLEA
jgi:hypothetical protein